MGRKNERLRDQIAPRNEARRALSPQLTGRPLLNCPGRRARGERGDRVPEKYIKPRPCIWSDRPEPQDTEKKGSTAVRQTVMEQFR